MSPPEMTFDAAARSRADAVGRAALMSAYDATLPVPEEYGKGSSLDWTVDLGYLGQRYHCDYCGKDISNASVRIRCAQCRDFDLCVPCFCRGREKGGHSSDHRYVPVGRFAFPLFHPEWSADEECQLLESISKFGFGNWNDVAESVMAFTPPTMRQKKKDQCERHFYETYCSTCPPIPDLSKLILPSKSAQPIVPSDLPAETTQSLPPPPIPPHATTLLGYMPLRGDFEVEFDNDAELIIADMEFREMEPPHEKELKLQVLEIYNSTLDARALRKKTVVGRNLADPKRQQQVDRKRTREERELHNLLRPLARLSFDVSHERLVSLLVDERKLRNRLVKLQEWRSLGLRTLDEVSKYEAAVAKAPPIARKVDGTSPERKSRRVGEGAEGAAKVDTLPGAELCNPAEISFCEEMQVAPIFYLLMKNVLLREVQAKSGCFADSNSFVRHVNLEGSKVGGLYDFVLHTKLNCLTKSTAPAPAATSRPQTAEKRARSVTTSSVRRRKKGAEGVAALEKGAEGVAALEKGAEGVAALEKGAEAAPHESEESGQASEHEATPAKESDGGKHSDDEMW